jgi:phosphoglycolate phosphatase
VTRLFLFDIDLTMIRTNRAGGVAMTETFHELLGVEDAFAGVEFGGRTDVSLLREAFERVQAEAGPDRPRSAAAIALAGDFEAFVAAFKARYLPRLAQRLRERGGVVLPGVLATLDAVAALPGARLGLATGNFRGAAEIKLRHFGLWERFVDGGFADDGEDRAHIVAAAIRRLSAAPGGAEAVYVFGDSTHDVLAAKANGAVAVGVATGGSSADILAAAGADVVVADLTDPAALLRRLLD